MNRILILEYSRLEDVLAAVGRFIREERQVSIIPTDKGWTVSIPARSGDSS